MYLNNNSSRNNYRIIFTDCDHSIVESDLHAEILISCRSWYCPSCTKDRNILAMTRLAVTPEVEV